ncbi:hypothetical protein LY76DRAFT_433511 [Colletotrichum caudatum]|nr:hypothetical protein LY76DRAFT_433511 [Colletotrichum caudatum]
MSVQLFPPIFPPNFPQSSRAGLLLTLPPLSLPSRALWADSKLQLTSFLHVPALPYRISHSDTFTNTSTTTLIRVSECPFVEFLPPHQPVVAPIDANCLPTHARVLCFSRPTTAPLCDPASLTDHFERVEELVLFCFFGYDC